MRKFATVLVAVMLAVLGGCDGSSPTAPPPPSDPGTPDVWTFGVEWAQSGVLTDATSASVILRVTEVGGTSLSLSIPMTGVKGGTWSAEINNGDLDAMVAAGDVFIWVVDGFRAVELPNGEYQLPFTVASDMTLALRRNGNSRKQLTTTKVAPSEPNGPGREAAKLRLEKEGAEYNYMLICAQGGVDMACATS